MFLSVLVFMLEVSKFDYFYELLEVCKNFLGIFAHSAMGTMTNVFQDDGRTSASHIPL